jgi:hypothetical protein
MSSGTRLFILVLLFNPGLLIAEQEQAPSYTPSEQILFAPSSQIAFDRSGKFVAEHTLVDGAIIAHHHGSIGNVTVARLGANGVVETYCTGDMDAAKAWMAGEFDVNPATAVTINLEEQ